MEISSCRVAASPYPAYKTENVGRVSAAPPGNKTLGDVIVPDHIGVQPLLIALHVIAHHDLGFP
jgi:hypothetical protein